MAPGDGMVEPRTRAEIEDRFRREIREAWLAFDFASQKLDQGQTKAAADAFHAAFQRYCKVLYRSSVFLSQGVLLSDERATD